MNDERNCERAPGRFAWHLLCAVPLLYVLSIGPVVAVAERLGAPAGPLRDFYAPIVWLVEHTSLAWPILWYVSLWH